MANTRTALTTDLLAPRTAQQQFAATCRDIPRMASTGARTYLFLYQICKSRREIGNCVLNATSQQLAVDLHWPFDISFVEKSNHMIPF
jgi:hypothetical protein